MQDVIVSGMRPTGELHLGHYVGVIRNWVKLQNDHRCFYFLADWHALTSYYDDLEVIRKYRFEYVRGWLASGLDPAKVCIYQQSSFPEVLYLEQFFLALTPPGWADRSPGWKDLQEHPQKRLDNLGFYTYPILMAADIALLRATKVPVGEDQLTHLEITREIVRKLNRTYGTDVPEPQGILTPAARLIGTDGHKKMSSSLGNTISLKESEKSLRKKINKLRTDDTRQGPTAPGNPANCTVFDYVKAFAGEADVQQLEQTCRAGGMSCGECKKCLADKMVAELMPLAERLSKISDDDCRQVIHEGNQKVQVFMKECWQALADKIKFFS